MAGTWYFQSMGNTIGPLSSTELRMRAVLGQIDASTLVAHEALEKWVRADRVNGLVIPPTPEELAEARRHQEPEKEKDFFESLDVFAPLPVGRSAVDVPVEYEEQSIYQYKVLTQKDKWFTQKFDPEKLEEALNSYARQGWRVVAATTASIPGFVGGNREEMIIIMER